MGHYECVPISSISSSSSSNNTTVTYSSNCNDDLKPSSSEIADDDDSSMIFYSPESIINHNHTPNPNFNPKPCLNPLSTHHAYNHHHYHQYHPKNSCIVLNCIGYCILVVLLLLPSSSQAVQREPFVCAGELDSACETRLCYDAIDLKQETIQSGCANKEQCIEPGCFMHNDQFVCCCENPVCNGKSEGLIRSRLMMWTSGEFTSATTQSISSTTISSSPSAGETDHAEISPVESETGVQLTGEHYLEQNETGESSHVVDEDGGEHLHDEEENGEHLHDVMVTVVSDEAEEDLEEGEESVDDNKSNVHDQHEAGVVDQEGLKHDEGSEMEIDANRQEEVHLLEPSEEILEKSMDEHQLESKLNGNVEESDKEENVEKEDETDKENESEHSESMMNEPESDIVRSDSISHDGEIVSTEKSDKEKPTVATSTVAAAVSTSTISDTTTESEAIISEDESEPLQEDELIGENHSVDQFEGNDIDNEDHTVEESLSDESVDSESSVREHLLSPFDEGLIGKFNDNESVVIDKENERKKNVEDVLEAKLLGDGEEDQEEQVEHLREEETGKDTKKKVDEEDGSLQEHVVEESETVTEQGHHELFEEVFEEHDHYSHPVVLHHEDESESKGLVAEGEGNSPEEVVSLIEEMESNDSSYSTGITYQATAEEHEEPDVITTTEAAISDGETSEETEMKFLKIKEEPDTSAKEEGEGDEEVGRREHLKEHAEEEQLNETIEEPVPLVTETPKLDNSSDDGHEQHHHHPTPEQIVLLAKSTEIDEGNDSDVDEPTVATTTSTDDTKDIGNVEEALRRDKEESELDEVGSKGGIDDMLEDKHLEVSDEHSEQQLVAMNGQQTNKSDDGFVTAEESDEITASEGEQERVDDVVDVTQEDVVDDEEKNVYEDEAAFLDEYEHHPKHIEKHLKKPAGDMKEFDEDELRIKTGVGESSSTDLLVAEGESGEEMTTLKDEHSSNENDIYEHAHLDEQGEELTNEIQEENIVAKEELLVKDKDLGEEEEMLTSGTVQPEGMIVPVDSDHHQQHHDIKEFEDEDEKMQKIDYFVSPLNTSSDELHPDGVKSTAAEVENSTEAAIDQEEASIVGINVIEHVDDGDYKHLESKSTTQHQASSAFADIEDSTQQTTLRKLVESVLADVSSTTSRWQEVEAEEMTTTLMSSSYGSEHDVDDDDDIGEVTAPHRHKSTTIRIRASSPLPPPETTLIDQKISSRKPSSKYDDYPTSERKNQRKIKRIKEPADGDKSEAKETASIPWWLVTLGGLITASLIGAAVYKLITDRRKRDRRADATDATSGQEMTPLNSDANNRNPEGTIATAANDTDCLREDDTNA